MTDFPRFEPMEVGLPNYGERLSDKGMRKLTRDLTSTLDAWFEAPDRPERSWDRLMLHVCCGPCAEFPLATLARYGGLEAAIYTNPNVQPEAEFTRRYDYAAFLMSRHGISLEKEGTSEPDTWLRWSERPKDVHCTACYGIRMARAAAAAAQHGCDTFTTTLTVSPYQNQAKIREAGERAAARYGVRFVLIDWTPGYYIGQRMARAHRLYRQRFCGCLYSIGESSFHEAIAEDLELDPTSIPTRRDDETS